MPTPDPEPRRAPRAAARPHRRLVLSLALLLTLTPRIETRAADPAALKIPTAEARARSVQRGVEYLLQAQNRDGSWGSARKTKDLNIFAPVPGSHHAFRTAVTAMAVEALIECGAVDREERARRSVERATEFLLSNLPKVRRADAVAIYNVWTHAYGIQALVALHKREPAESPRRARFRQEITNQFDLLRRYESVDGGWGYYDMRVGAQRPSSDATSFTTATVLLAFAAAHSIGLAPPEPMVRRALASVVRQRKQDFSYLYGEYLRYRPQIPINRAAGSLGRSQACNLALRTWGDTNITTAVLTEWLDKLIARNEWLSFGRKRPVPHESWFQVAGYFFYYGHYYAALCAAELPPGQARQYHDQLAAVLLPLQEKDGSWFDFPFYDYHQPYGTAFALLTLARGQGPAK